MTTADEHDSITRPSWTRPLQDNYQDDDSDDDLPVIPIDGVRALIRPDQLLNDERFQPIAGLQVGTPSVELLFQLDEGDPVLFRQQTNLYGQAPSPANDAETDDDENNSLQRDRTPAEVISKSNESSTDTETQKFQKEQSTSLPSTSTTNDNPVDSHASADDMDLSVYNDDVSFLNDDSENDEKDEEIQNNSPQDLKGIERKKNIVFISSLDRPNAMNSNPAPQDRGADDKSKSSPPPPSLTSEDNINAEDFRDGEDHDRKIESLMLDKAHQSILDREENEVLARYERQVAEAERREKEIAFDNEEWIQLQRDENELFKKYERMITAAEDRIRQEKQRLEEMKEKIRLQRIQRNNLLRNLSDAIPLDDSTNISERASEIDVQNQNEQTDAIPQVNRSAQIDMTRPLPPSAKSVIDLEKASRVQDIHRKRKINDNERGSLSNGITSSRDPSLPDLQVSVRGRTEPKTVSAETIRTQDGHRALNQKDKINYAQKPQEYVRVQERSGFQATQQNQESRNSAKQSPNISIMKQKTGFNTPSRSPTAVDKLVVPDQQRDASSRRIAESDESRNLKESVNLHMTETGKTNGIEAGRAEHDDKVNENYREKIHSETTSIESPESRRSNNSIEASTSIALNRNRQNNSTIQLHPEADASKKKKKPLNNNLNLARLEGPVLNDNNLDGQSVGSIRQSSVSGDTVTDLSIRSGASNIQSLSGNRVVTEDTLHREEDIDKKERALKRKQWKEEQLRLRTLSKQRCQNQKENQRRRKLQESNRNNLTNISGNKQRDNNVVAKQNIDFGSQKRKGLVHDDTKALKKKRRLAENGNPIGVEQNNDLRSRSETSIERSHSNDRSNNEDGNLQTKPNCTARTGPMLDSLDQWSDMDDTSFGSSTRTQMPLVDRIPEGLDSNVAGLLPESVEKPSYARATKIVPSTLDSKTIFLSEKIIQHSFFINHLKNKAPLLSLHIRQFSVNSLLLEFNGPRDDVQIALKEFRLWMDSWVKVYTFNRIESSGIAKTIILDAKKSIGAEVTSCQYSGKNMGLLIRPTGAESQLAQNLNVVHFNQRGIVATLNDKACRDIQGFKDAKMLAAFSDSKLRLQLKFSPQTIRVLEKSMPLEAAIDSIPKLKITPSVTSGRKCGVDEKLQTSVDKLNQTTNFVQSATTKIPLQSNSTTAVMRKDLATSSAKIGHSISQSEKIKAKSSLLPTSKHVASDTVTAQIPQQLNSTAPVMRKEPAAFSAKIARSSSQGDKIMNNSSRLPANRAVASNTIGDQATTMATILSDPRSSLNGIIEYSKAANATSVRLDSTKVGHPNVKSKERNKSDQSSSLNFSKQRNLSPTLTTQQTDNATMVPKKKRKLNEETSPEKSSEKAAMVAYVDSLNNNTPGVGQGNENRKLKQDKQEGFREFSNKFRDIVTVEFKDAELQKLSALLGMWKPHKSKYGTTCKDDCNCFLDLPFLAESVIPNHVDKNDTNFARRVPLQDGKYPVGLAGNFAETFLPKLKHLFPRTHSSVILRRLLQLWEVHSTIYGPTCSKACLCENGWETRFKTALKTVPAKKAGKPKLQAKSGLHIGETKTTQKPTEPDESTVVGPLANRSEKIFQRKQDLQKIALPRKKDKKSTEQLQKERNESMSSSFAEYEVAFNCLKPLGFYCVSNGHHCRIKSVCPTGQRVDDQRIQPGTLVLSASTNSGKDWIPLKSHDELKDIFEQCMLALSELRLMFVNTYVTVEILNKAAKFQRKDWTDKGQWVGIENQGWDGGAAIIDPQNAISVNIDSSVLKRKQGIPDEQQSEAAVSPQDDGDIWKRIDAPRPLLNIKPEGLLENQDKKRQKSGSRKIKFAESFERRVYEIGSLPYQMFVLASDLVKAEETETTASTVIENDGDELTNVVHSGTCEDLIRLLQHGVLENMKTPDTLSRLRQEIKHEINLIDDYIKSSPKNEALARKRDDFRRKDVVMKVYINSYHIVTNARALKQWERFEVVVETIEELQLKNFLKIGQDSMLKTVATIVYDKDRGDPEMLANYPEKNIEVPIDFGIESPSFCVNHNHALSARVIDVSLTMLDPNTKITPLGSIEIRTSDLHDQCLHSRTWKHLTIEGCKNDYIESAKLRIRVRCVDLEPLDYSENKRKQLHKSLNDVCEWIDRFDREEGTKLTSNIQIYNNLSLLHGAISIADLGLVERVLQLGANPLAKCKNGSPLQVAKNMADRKVGGRETTTNIEDDNSDDEFDDEPYANDSGIPVQSESKLSPKLNGLEALIRLLVQYSKRNTANIADDSMHLNSKQNEIISDDSMHLL